MDGMRVLIVTESFLPQVNGVTNSVLRVVDHLAKRGHAAHVVAPTGPPAYRHASVDRVGGHQLRMYPGFPIGVEHRRRLRQVVRRFEPDVVHLASPALLCAQAAAVARDHGVPAVAVYQTDLAGFAARYPVPGAPAAMRLLTRAAHRHADITLAPSSAAVAQVAGLGIHPVSLWPRGVDTELFSPAHHDRGLHERLAPHGEVLVGYVGRLAREKDLERLAAVVGLPGARLVVVGDGPLRGRLERVLTTAVFLGELHGADLASAYATLDVFVHPGRHETFCQAIQEAMSSGLPVVAVDAGGPRDLVEPGVTGYLVAVEDDVALRRAVERLVADPVCRARLGGRAVSAVADRSWEAVGDQLLDEYRAVVRRRQDASGPLPCPS